MKPLLMCHPSSISRTGAPQDEAPDPFECQDEQQPEDPRVERIQRCVPLREEQDKIGENEYVDDPRGHAYLVCPQLAVPWLIHLLHEYEVVSR
jgi:hypothetical protein